MIVLGIDSSTDRLAVGLADGSGIILEDRLDAVQEHASQIMGMIDSVLTKASLPKQKLDGIAVADGPGSFTGLRIGMAAAKGIALALGLPLVGVSTFEVLARRLTPQFDCFYLAAMVRRGEMYLCRVEKDIDIRKSIIIVDQSAIPEQVGLIPVGLIGREPDGWTDLIKNRITAEQTAVSGGELALCGAEMTQAGRVADLAALEPFYLAPSQAEKKFGRK